MSFGHLAHPPPPPPESAQQASQPTGPTPLCPLSCSPCRSSATPYHAGRPPPLTLWSRSSCRAPFQLGHAPLPYLTRLHPPLLYYCNSSIEGAPFTIAACPSRPPPPPSDPYKRVPRPRLTSPHPTPSSLPPLSHQSVILS
jgi:hypothetical protein